MQISMLAVAFALASFTSNAAGAQNGPLFHFMETRGPYSVGFRVVEQYDQARTYGYRTDVLGKPAKGERARPMQTLVWYPATETGSRPMTVGDYGTLWGKEVNFREPTMLRPALKWLASMKPTLPQTLWATRDAPQTVGRFPIIIYSPSWSSVPTPWENADLCEYLASHGYIVLASPNLGTKSRNITPDVAGIDTQAGDISFLIGYAQTLSDSDSSVTAVVGFSWGGIANLFAAARDRRIAALVALDGSMRYFPGLVRQAGNVHPEQMTIPLLYFTQADFSIEDRDRLTEVNDTGPNILNAWTHGDLVTVHMLGLLHEEFGSMYQRSEDMWEAFDDPDSPSYQRADYTRGEGMIGYGWVARYTLAFLDAYLKHEALALKFLRNTPAQNGAPKHFMSVAYRTAKGVPPSFEGFRGEIGRLGFDHSATIYAAMREENADFTLEDGEINSWAEELIDDNHSSEAIALLLLNVQIHPASGDAYLDLGDAYKISGQKELAIDSYRKSLERDPVFRQARGRLEALRGAP